MPRKGPAPRRDLMPDPIHRSVLVTQLVNKVLLRGKRSTAEKIVYDALSEMERKTGTDPLATLNQSLRSVFSMTVGYQPPKPLSDVDRPVRVLIGEADQMLPDAQASRSLERMRLRNLQVEVVDGGHMLLHEDPEEVLDAVTGALAEFSE